MTIQQHASFDSSAAELNATSKLVKAWETKNAKNAAKVGGISMMALSLAACGGSSSTTTTATTTTTTTAVSQAISLTTGIDTVVGGDGSDSITGGATSAATQTLNTLDSINGGGGTDTITAVIAANVTPGTISVENYVVSATAAATLDLSGSTGIASLTNTGSSNTLSVTNIGGDVAITLSSTADGGTFNYAASAVAGTADAKTVNVSGVTGGTLNMGTGVEALTVNSIGSANSLAGVTTGATSITITGDQNLTIAAAGELTQTTVDASAATGKITLQSDAATDVTITGGSGNDSITADGGSAITETVDMGAGNDTLTFDANLADADVLNGGDGTDTLVGINANVVGLTSAATTSNVTNFEAVSISDEMNGGAGFDISDVQESGIATLNLLNASDTTNVTNAVESITGEAGAFTINLGGSAANNSADIGGNLTLVDSGTATTDSVTLVNKSVDSTASKAVNVFGGVDITSTGYETVTLDTGARGSSNTKQTAGTITITPDAVSAGVGLTVTGGNSIDIAASLTSTSTGALTIDASGMTAQTTGTVTFDVASVTMGTAGTITATGSAGDDNFGAAGAALGNFASTINGGAGADSITTGTAIDTVNGGAGDDVIDVGAGLGDSADGGAGDDTITIAADANLTSTDTYVGGDGTDIIAFGTAITDSAATFSAFSGFETLQLAPGAADAYTLSNFINNTSLTQLNFGDAGGNTITVTNAPASMTTVRVLAGAAGDTLSFDRLVDNTTNSLTVDLRGGGITTLLTAADEETITISGNAATDDTVITTLTAGDLTTLNITGAADVTTTNNITSTVLATVDASAATGAVDLDAGDSVVAITATGGSGGFTFEGGSGSDTITGGAGVDVILGNAGTDTISGGAGADDITGGNGADILTGGTGLDAFFYDVATVAAQGGDTITDFTGSQGDEISLNIASAGAAAGTADGFVECDANGLGANAITNADLVVVVDGIVIDVSGVASADLAAINAVTADSGTDELAANAEAIIIFNADTNGDGSADEVQAWWLHETSASASQADVAAYIATFSNLAGTADLTDVFTATNAEFL